MDAQLSYGDSQGERRSECAHSPHNTIGSAPRYPMSEQHTPETKSHMGDDKPNAERVVGNEPHVPRVGQETYRSAGRP